MTKEAGAKIRMKRAMERIEILKRTLKTLESPIHRRRFTGMIKDYEALIESIKQDYPTLKTN